MEDESWLKEIEKVFQALKCLEKDKVDFMTFMILGETADWWKVGKEKASSELCTIHLESG